MSSDEVFQAEPAPRKSSGSKVWIYLGLGCGVMLLLCCGVIGGFIWWGYTIARESMITDPTKVAAMGRQIAPVDLPDRYRPVFAMDFTKIVERFGGRNQDGKPTRAVWYASNQAGDKGGGMVMLFEVKGGSAAAAEQSRQTATSMSQGGAPQAQVPANAELVNSETHSVTIHGEQADFMIMEYHDNQANKTYWQAHGAFRNDTGWVYFLLIDSGDDIDKDQIVQIIDSIQ